MPTAPSRHVSGDRPSGATTPDAGYKGLFLEPAWTIALPPLEDDEEAASVHTVPSPARRAHPRR